MESQTLADSRTHRRRRSRPCTPRFEEFVMRCKNALTLAAVAPLVLAACTDTTKPTAPAVPATPIVATGPASPLVALTCTASVGQGTVACAAPDDGASGAARDVIIGGQNQYVTLTSSNIQVVADTFAFDASVKNLIPQPIGTTNGTTTAPTGVRVFSIRVRRPLPAVRSPWRILMELRHSPHPASRTTSTTRYSRRTQCRRPSGESSSSRRE